MTKAKIKIFFRTHIESILVIFFSFLLVILVYVFFREKYVLLYLQNGLNSVFIELFGSLLGLMITAYAILFGLIPVLQKDFIDSSTFDRLNKRFLYTIFSNLLLLILSILINFIDMPEKNMIVFFHLFVMIFAFSMILLLTIYLYFLFKIAKKHSLRN